MNSESDNIMGYRRELTEREIRDYHNGDLSPEERNAIERTAASHPLSQEALEGWKGDHSSALSEIRTEVGRRSGGSTLFYAAIIVGVVFGTGIGIWFAADQFGSDHQAENIVQLEEEPAEASLEPGLSRAEEQPIEIIEQHSTDSSVSITTSRMEELAEDKDPFVTRVRIENPEAIPLKQVHALDHEHDPSVDATKPVLPGERIYHIEDYKVVDYRGIREAPISGWNIKSGGVPAEYENADELNNSELRAEMVTVPYVDFLQSIIVEFSSAEYKLAIRGCEDILDTYPDDANALFYLAMAYYYNEQFEYAEKAFLKSLNVPVRIFRQESRFYLGKSFLATGQIEKANSVFRVVAEEEGFYAEKALELLKD
jgi:tetratricopeptide (TPR) repeat protein